MLSRLRQRLAVAATDGHDGLRSDPAPRPTRLSAVTISIPCATEGCDGHLHFDGGTSSRPLEADCRSCRSRYQLSGGALQVVGR